MLRIEGSRRGLPRGGLTRLLFKRGFLRGATRLAWSLGPRHRIGTRHQEQGRSGAFTIPLPSQVKNTGLLLALNYGGSYAKAKQLGHVYGAQNTSQQAHLARSDNYCFHILVSWPRSSPRSRRRASSGTLPHLAMINPRPPAPPRPPHTRGLSESSFFPTFISLSLGILGGILISHPLTSRKHKKSYRNQSPVTHGL